MLSPHPDLQRPPGRLSPLSLPVVAPVAGAPVPAVDGVVLVLGAHPDDETVGAGRLVAHLAARGRVAAHVATAGEGCFAGRETPGVPDVGELRRSEWRAAVTALGAEPGRCAGLADGSLARHPDRVRAWAAEVVDAVGPAVLVAPWRLDPHPDHAAIGSAAARVARERGLTLWEYPVWAPAWCTPEQVGASGWRLEARWTDPSATAARAAALRCYPSQVHELVAGWGAVVPADALAHHAQQLVCVREAV